MRAALSRKILNSLVNDTPDFFIRFQLQVLLNITARAFAVSGKRIWHMDSNQALSTYTAFTKECLEHRQVEEERLYQEAYRAGCRIRRITSFQRGGICKSWFFICTGILRSR